MSTLSHLFCSASGAAVKDEDAIYLTALSKSISNPESAITALSLGFPAKFKNGQIQLLDMRKNLKHVQELILFLTKSASSQELKKELTDLQNNPAQAIDYLFKLSINNSLVFTYKTKEYYLKFSAVSAQHVLDFDIDHQEQLSLYKLIKDFSLKTVHQLQYARKNEDLEIIVDYSVEEAIAKLLCDLSSPLCVKEEYPWCHSSVVQNIKYCLQQHVNTLKDDTEKLSILPRSVVMKVMQELYFVLKYAATLSIVAGALCPARVLTKNESATARPGKSFN